MSFLAFPYRITAQGRTGTADQAAYAASLVEQVVLTTPGERINRPDFGAGLRQLVFVAPTSELLTTSEFLIQGALVQWLSDMIAVESVSVAMEDVDLVIEVVYRLAAEQQRITQTVRSPGLGR